jgi:quinol monooxygenase YgiN
VAGVILLVDLQVKDPVAFAAAAKKLVDISQAEPGTLRYEWFSSDDGRAVRIIEEFVDEAALTVHGEHIESTVPELLAAADIVGTEVLGEVSAERRERMAGPATGFLGYYAGFKR